MFELLMDFDYQAIRQAMLAAYLLTIVFPIAVMYFSYHSSAYDRKSDDRLVPNIHSHI